MVRDGSLSGLRTTDRRNAITTAPATQVDVAPFVFDAGTATGR